MSREKSIKKMKEIFLLVFVIELISFADGGCGCECEAKTSTHCQGGLEWCKINVAANRDSLCKLGIKTGLIPDTAFDASSQTSTFDPKYGRLDQQFIPGVARGCWAAGQNVAGQWIQVTLQQASTITGVITQGRDNYDQWVTQFTVSYLGPFDQEWKFVKTSDGSTATFSGNTDRDSHVTNMFNTPIYAIKLRINPTSWFGHISLRHEYLRC